MINIQYTYKFIQFFKNILHQECGDFPRIITIDLFCMCPHKLSHWSIPQGYFQTLKSSTCHLQMFTYKTTNICITRGMSHDSLNRYLFLVDGDVWMNPKLWTINHNHTVGWWTLNKLAISELRCEKLRHPGVTNLASKLGQIGSNGTNLGLFKICFSTV